MKLIITIVSKDDSQKVTKSLLGNDFFVTKLSSTGGFLRGGNVTLMTGVNDVDVEKVINIISNCCKSRKEFKFLRGNRSGPFSCHAESGRSGPHRRAQPDQYAADRRKRNRQRGDRPGNP